MIIIHNSDDKSCLYNSDGKYPNISFVMKLSSQQSDHKVTDINNSNIFSYNPEQNIGSPWVMNKFHSQTHL